MDKWQYDKLQEDGTIKTISGDFQNDLDGKITGHIVMNVKAWFDENPAERIRLGWTKHILHYESEVDYNKQTQFLSKCIMQVDESSSWTRAKSSSRLRKCSPSPRAAKASPGSCKEVAL